MKLFRLIPVYAAAALILVPAVFAAQTQQATETTKETTKKAKKRAKKTEEQAGEAAAPAKSESQTTEAPKARTKPPATGSAQRATPTVSDSDIAAAKASGMVWVNTETGVYHKGGRWYGATKQGKFMTEDDAIKAGYRASKSK
jgi:hypothetical protein